MKYEESYKRLEDILTFKIKSERNNFGARIPPPLSDSVGGSGSRRAKDNQGNIIISTDDTTSIKEAEIAICRMSRLGIKKREKIIFLLFCSFYNLIMI